MKLCGIIVTYFPDHEKLVLNIKSVINDVDSLLIWDNTPDKYFIDKDKLSCYGTKILIMGFGENLGIAGGLNKGVNWAVENGFSHLLTLDQDSNFHKNHLNSFKKKILNKEKHLDSAAIFCPNLFCDNKLVFPQNISETPISDAITSGSIFPIKVFLECGLFNEDLFIDAVDYEFCYRAYTLKGYKTIILNDIVLNHEVGYKSRNKLGFYSDNYSAFRVFHIVRNHIMTWRAYPQLFQRRHKTVLVLNHILFRFPKVLLGEKDKMNKIAGLFKGLYKGLFTVNLIKRKDE